MLSAMYCIAMTEISKEEEQALLEVQLDNMALEEQPTVAASTSDMRRQLQVLQNNRSLQQSTVYKAATGIHLQ